MHPAGALLPAGAPRDKIVEPEVSQFVPAVRGEDYRPRRRRVGQRAQAFEPGDKAAAALGGRLPPRAARRHHDERWAGAAAVGYSRDDVAGARRRAAALGDEPARRALRRRGKQHGPHFARDMNRRRATGRTEALGIEQSHAGALSGAQDDDAAMTAAPAQPLEFAAIDRARRQLGDKNFRIAAGQSQPAAHSRRIGRRRLENRDCFDPLAAEFEKSGHRIEPVEREFLDRHRGTERRCLPRQPLGAGRVAGAGRAMGALRIPIGQPSRGAALCVVEE
jgi:hypothetical protein